MPVTKDQAEMIATLAVAARPHGARRWDAPGVMAAMSRVRHLDLAEVMMAVARAARDSELNTPAPIGNPAALCWIERPVERFEPDKTTAEDRCGICGRSRGRCESAPRHADDDHSFESDFKTKRDGEVVSQIVTAVKAEVAPTAEPTDRPKPDATEQRDPRVQAARDAVTTNPTPHAQPRDHETGASA